MTINTEFIGFDYASEDILAEINRNITTLINTPAGTCPGDRNYGVSIDYVSMPNPVAQNETALEIIEKVDEYEPRATVSEVEFAHDDDGYVVLNLLIDRNEDYEEE